MVFGILVFIVGKLKFFFIIVEVVVVYFLLFVIVIKYLFVWRLVGFLLLVLLF